MPRFPGTEVPGVEERLHHESVLEFREHASQESRAGSLLAPVSDPADRCQRGSAAAKDCKGNAEACLMQGHAQLEGQDDFIK